MGYAGLEVEMYRVWDNFSLLVSVCLAYVCWICRYLLLDIKLF